MKRSSFGVLAGFLTGGRQDLLSDLPQSDAEWEQLLRHAAEEYVLPALHERIAELGLAPHVPEEVAECLATVAALNRERNSKMLADFWHITQPLNRASIEPVALKGLAYLLSRTYDDAANRYLLDIDVLIPEAQINKAVEVLQREAYSPDALDSISQFRHHIPMYRRGNAPIELHHSVGLGVCRRLLPASELFESSSVTDWNGIRVRIPSPDHLVTHLILHSQLRHPYSERIWPPLRALYDLALLRRRFESAIDWTGIERRFRLHGEYATLALHLLQFQESLGIPSPLPLKLDPFTNLRWKRRRALRRLPALRFVDPTFVAISALSRRSRVLRAMSKSPGGWRYLGRRLSQPGFYRQLVADLDRGRD